MASGEEVPTYLFEYVCSSHTADTCRLSRCPIFVYFSRPYACMMYNISMRVGRRVEVEELLGDNCPADAQRATMAETVCQKLVQNRSAYPCWLGLEGNDEHGHVVLQERTELPVLGLVLGTVISAAYVAYLGKKMMEMCKLWAEVTKQSDETETKTTAAEAVGVQPAAPRDAGDHPDLFEFDDIQHVALESDRQVQLTVVRRAGSAAAAHGGDVSVLVPYHTENVSMDEDVFVETKGELVFGPGEMGQSVQIKFRNDANFQTIQTMLVILGQPTIVGTGSAMAPAVQLGHHQKASVAVLSDDRFPDGLQSTDNLIETVTAFFKHTWRVKAGSFKKCIHFQNVRVDCDAGRA
eukprot:COSAG01_NODE_319_length_18909_cov_32.636151_14_plen_351_part_00